MSTYSSTSRRREGTTLSVFIVQCVCCVLGVLLVALLAMMQFMFYSPTASAYTSRQSFHLASPPSPVDKLTTLLGPSVVRLLVIYTATANGSTTTSSCTGLGVLVSSISSDNGQQQNTLLTDGSLVSPDKETCAAPSAGAKPPALPLPAGVVSLSSIEVFLSRGYSGSGSQNQIVSFPANTSKNAIVCQEAACENGAALVTFSSTATVLPFVSLASSDNSQQKAIALTDQNKQQEPLQSGPLSREVVSQYLTPQEGATEQGNLSGEVGTPVFNLQGQLSGMKLKNLALAGFQAQTIAGLLTGHASNDLSSNLVASNWNQGVEAYYKGDYAGANSFLTKVTGANSQFKGANELLTKVSAANSASNTLKGTSTPPPNSVFPGGNVRVPGLPFTIPLIVMAGIIGLLLVLLLLIVLARWFSHARRGQVLKKRLAEIDPQATADAQHIRQEEALQSSQQPTAWAQSAPAQNIQNIQAMPQMSHQPQMAPMPIASPSPVLHCPRCNAVVQRDTVQCPSCSQWLSPTDSGLHMRVQMPPQPQQMSPALGPSVQPQLASASAFVDQPTIDMANNNALANGNGGSSAANGMDRSMADESTLPAFRSPRQLSGNEPTLLPVQRPVSFEIVTNTNPGKKRMHKPNEDSLFAAQGARLHNGVLQQVGLFVVADGMGGHANGQDASRLAIQTIINSVIPTLMHNSEANVSLAQLLSNGIQKANEAVHTHNMDNRADMGTTVTATLVVDATAYVSNVGDSRTYLYRFSEGLVKVTRDHSVVASLVDAGIIKPDDIYTHPKRNQIYRSLGEKPVVEVDSFTVLLQPGYKMLLCSDGLWDMVRDPKIEAVLKEPVSDPNKIGDNLIQAALDGGGEDNVSVIVVNVMEGPKQELKLGLTTLAIPETLKMPSF